jgi:hypothetical protein
MVTRHASVIALVALLSGCMPVRVRDPHLYPASQAPRSKKGEDILKVHMKCGELYVLRSWELVGDGARLRGNGTRYSPARVALGDEAPQVIAVPDVALLETNHQKLTFPFAAQSLAALTTYYGALSVMCLADPKSCFGSCPTFYAEAGPDLPQAEGFSDSIARALEARDVDALWNVRGERGRVALRMRNEALETQAVNDVRLLVAPRPPGGRVVAGPDGRLYAATTLTEPSACLDAAGSCLAALRSVDALERTSAADAENLAVRETLELEFPSAASGNGLILGARQSLLTTFLFYQSMAYAGAAAGDFLARIETGGPAAAERALGMARLLGGIEVDIADAGGWRPIGSFREAGPLAGDIQVLPFDPPGAQGPLRFRLRFAKGAWRLGYSTLAQLGAPVAPRVVEVARVEREGRVDEGARALLRDPGRYLITLPGDQYRLIFELPEHLEDPELFLESQGYYYEWQRSEWLKEEDPEMLSLVLARPDEALRRLARPFKEREAEMEGTFWQSRFRR